MESINSPLLKNNGNQVYGFENDFNNDTKLNELFSEKELKESGARGNRFKKKMKSDTIKEVDEKTSLDKINYRDESDGMVNNQINNLISDVSSITKDNVNSKDILYKFILKRNKHQDFKEFILKQR